MFIVKYLKSIFYILISILIFGLLITILNYFNIINSNTINYLKLISIIISFIIGGIDIGRKGTNKGYLEGLKIAAISIVILLLLNILGFNKGISIDTIIYYLIITISTVLGSIIGINKKRV